MDLYRFKREADISISVTVKDSDGVAEDITGWTIKMMSKKNVDDADADAVFDVTVTTHTDPTAGKSLIEIANADNTQIGNFPTDVKFIDALDKVQYTDTFLMVVTQNITDGD